MNNQQFSITFGQEPKNIINRDEISSQIINDFKLDVPFSRTYIITGVRGSGKTVLQTKIRKEFNKDKDWITVNVNPDRDILEQIGTAIYINESVKHLFTKKTFSFSFHGFSFSIEGAQPVNDIKIVISKMLSEIKKHNKKVLITIDEVRNEKSIRSFITDYQSLISDDYPLFLIMTGLVENVDSLQHNKNLTFLYRTPKYYLGSLNINLIKESYKKIFKSDDSTIEYLAKLTNGYAFAYQVIGFLYSKYNDINKINFELDQYLKSYVYDMIYEPLPQSEKVILKIIAPKEKLDCKTIIKNSNLSPKEFSVYRERLIKRGLVNGEKRGYLTFTLPRFNLFVNKQI